MEAPALLAIVGVDREDRVACQAEGCGHGVYAAIHVVRCGDGQLRVYGSDCYGRLFEHLMPSAKPRFGGGAVGGARLTKQDRDLLMQNTAAFIAKLEEERLQQHEHALARLKRLRERAVGHVPQARMVMPAGPARSAGREEHVARRAMPTEQDLAPFVGRAKEYVRQRYSVDPELPGWRGLVMQRATELLQGAGADRTRGGEDLLS